MWRVNVSLLHGLLSECASGALGMASGEIPDSSITASSYQKFWEFDREPKYARLGHADRYWVNDLDDTEPWLQVDLGGSRRVTGLKTEGNYKTDIWQYWVEKIKVQVGVTEGTLMFIKDTNGQQKVCEIIYCKLVKLSIRLPSSTGAFLFCNTNTKRHLPPLPRFLL